MISKLPRGFATLMLISLTLTVGMFLNVKTAQAANCGGETVCACGDTVTSSYTLTSDLTCTGHGLVVGADGITIDGGSYTITGDGGSADQGIRNIDGYDNITIKNLNITNFSYGVYLHNCTGSIIQNITANSNTYGIYLSSSSSNTLSDNTANLNASYGIQLFSSSSNTLSDNTANSNINGINLSSSSSNALSNNTANLNASFGIYLYLSSSNTLTGNIMSDNQSNLHISGSSTAQYNNTIDTTNTVEGKSVYYFYDNDGTAENPLIYDGDVLGNDIGMFWCISCDHVQVKNVTLSANNYCGVCFNNTTNSTIDHVIANSNSSYGIQLYSSSSNTLSNNTANSNINGINLSSSSSNTLSNNTANLNAHFGINLSSSSSNTLINNTANLNTSFGIHLYSSSSNTLSDNTANLNASYGIQLYSSSSNTLSNITANSNIHGIHLYSSSSNTLSNITANSNTYGIYLSSSSSNTLNGNTISNNIYDIYNTDTTNSYSSNRFNHNTTNKMLTFTDTARTKNVDDTVSFSISAFTPAGADCNSCTAIITYPSETVTIDSETGNDITGHFTVTKSGIYSLNFTVTDSNSNTTKRNYLFFVGSTSSQTTRYYLRGVNPTHGQPAGTDGKSLLLTAPTNTEEWTCGGWIQNSPDEIPIYPLANLSGIDTYSWYKQSMESGAYIGIQRYVAYGITVDFDSSVDSAADYTWINKNFTGLFNWAMDYSYNWYWLSLKLYGTNPYWQTTAAQPSYVDFTYSYTITPAVKSISNKNIIVLSATADSNATSSVSIVLENTLSSATSTDVVLTDFKRPFLRATSTIDSVATTTISTPSISANTTSTFDSAPMDITPSSGSIDVVIDTWNTSGSYYKQWTETGTDVSQAEHTIGDLGANTYYTVKVDGSRFGAYLSNTSGEITFTYTGPYSTKTFEVATSSACEKGILHRHMSPPGVNWGCGKNIIKQPGRRKSALD